ncbi:MAG: peptide ABC transporter permease [Sneathiella sp.]|jgi:peptide/nickel transport system permease protein|uniref:ABC transporter permease n=1 Tax=Sneathiella sp. TaxID=1964365 RepID=UPI000C5E5C34|nr:ABC transporter permease [Sneathiella sp.]MAL80710.1 peptide ABC transporter permease [Sneathiella sp.]
MSDTVENHLQTAPDEIAAVPVARLSPKQQLIARMRGHFGFKVGLIVLVTFTLVAILAPWIAPHDPYAQDLANRLVQPVWSEKGSWAHILGTDSLGRDYLSRLIYGAQISLVIGFSAMLISGLIGTVMGITAGYFGGRVDMVISFIILNRLSMPVVLVALAVVSLFGSSLIIVILVLGFLLWDRFAVVLRSATMQVRAIEYVAAAEVLGSPVRKILFRDILPNVSNHLLVVASIEMAHAILLEASLSFLGLGVQPPLPSWGLMVSEARPFMFFMPWLITIPGTAIFIVVLAINLLGDGLRDVTAPEGRN